MVGNSTGKVGFEASGIVRLESVADRVKKEATLETSASGLVCCVSRFCRFGVSEAVLVETFDLQFLQTDG